VIFEYKRAVNENVINQGLFYLDWLMDHRGNFRMLVLDCLGTDAAAAIDWRNPHLICVASGFTKYDEYAVQQINRSIELVRYRDFGGEFLALELITATKVEAVTSEGARPRRLVRRQGQPLRARARASPSISTKHLKICATSTSRWRRSARGSVMT
jgi:hypothetical protein